MEDVTIPKVHGEAGVVAAYACDEVLLEGADGFLGMVGAVAMRRDKLEVFVGFGHEFIEPGGALIVEDVQGRLESAQTEVFVKGGVSAHHFCFAAIFHVIGKYGVGDILVEYHEVLIAFAGYGGETNGLVSGDFSAYFQRLQEEPAQ